MVLNGAFQGVVMAYNQRQTFCLQKIFLNDFNLVRI